MPSSALFTADPLPFKPEPKEGNYERIKRTNFYGKIVILKIFFLKKTFKNYEYT
jgi:hypothetical protein